MRGTWRLAGYRIESLIGAGSSGEVWRATVTSTGVPVALKRIWVSGPVQRDSAVGEAAMLSTLDHAHLMKLHEVRTTDDAVVLVLDLAAAGSLADLLARRGRLTPGEVVTALAPIGSALAYAHNRHVVHGDVSPANILFTDIGLPLLADLGVARLLGRSGPVRTTPPYADPSVALGGIPIAPSDVFMLGAVALHALTGAPPWPGADAAAVLELAASAGEPPDFGARLAAAGVPPAVAKVVERALDPDQSERGTAAEFALELRHAATPVAVELEAGRARHAADTLQSWPLEPVATDDGSRPRSTAAGPPFARLPLTEGVRAPVPFTRAPGARHQAVQRRRRRVLLAVATLFVLAAGVVAFWPGRGRADRVAAVRDRVPASASPAVDRGGGPVMRATRSVSRATPSAPAAGGRDAIAGVLGQLDAMRARAFAARDPALLAGVYASPVLVARDRATLLSTVPPGCRLDGVHTAFRALRAVRAGRRVRVEARVVVDGGHLLCGAAPGVRAARASPVPMTIVLRRSGSVYRIVSEQRR